MATLKFDATFGAAPPTGGDDYPNTHALDIIAMRNITFDPATLGNVNSVEIVSQPDIGVVKLLADNTLVIDMASGGDIIGSTEFTYSIVNDIGPENCVVTVSILESLQTHGHPEANHFFFPVDDTTGNWATLEAEGWQGWYISLTGDGYADMPTVSNASQLKAAWPLHGGSPETAIDLVVALSLHQSLPDNNHMTFYFEKGGDYSVGIPDDFGNLGISAMRPLKITSYGTGAKPIIRSQSRNFGDACYTIFEDFQLTNPGNFTFLGGACIGINKVDAGSREWNIQKAPHFTIMNSVISNTNKSNNGVGEWEDLGDKNSGIFFAYSDDTYLLDNFWHHNGWEDGYIQNFDKTVGISQPPSQFSHGVYSQGDSRHQTFIGQISTRAASQGLQWRPGGFGKFNAGFSNPFGPATLGQGRLGGGHKIADESVFGFHYRTISVQGYNPPLQLTGWKVGSVDSATNIIARHEAVHQLAAFHYNNPNAPVDSTHVDVQAGKWQTMDKGIQREIALRGEYLPGSSWSTTGWNAGKTGHIDESSNADPLNHTIGENYTIQLWADGYFGGTHVTSDDVITSMLALDDYRGVAENMCNYFVDGMYAVGQTEFARNTAVRTVADTIVFKPEPNGMCGANRADNPLNWIAIGATEQDYAGFISGDSSNLQGFNVTYCIPKAITLTDVTLGPSGGMFVSASKVTLTGSLIVDAEGGNFGTTTSGQLLFPGYSGTNQLDMSVTGGLLANVGSVTGNASLTMVLQTFPENANHRSNSSYAMLATSGNTYTIGATQVMNIGGWCTAGFDAVDGGTATLDAVSGAVINFTVGGTGNNTTPAMGQITDFKTGLYSGDLDVVSNVDLTGVTINIDATGLAGSHTLIDISGTLTQATTVNITGGGGSVAWTSTTLIWTAA